MNWLFPRFRTAEDAKVAMECYEKGEPIPPDIWIFPFMSEEHDGHKVLVWNPEYTSAQYEVKHIGGMLDARGRKSAVGKSPIQ